MSFIKQYFVPIVAIILMGFGYFIVTSAWEQTCVGIFEDKRLCELKRDYNADLAQCREISWDRCDKLVVNGQPSQSYDSCLEKARCSCMKRNGHRTC